MGTKRGIVRKLEVLSTEIGMLMSTHRELVANVRELARVTGLIAGKRHVSVLLLGECLIDEPRRKSPLMLAETYHVAPGENHPGFIEPMIPVAPGAWLVAVGIPSLGCVRVGHDLQHGNIGHGGPVVRLCDPVNVGQRVLFDLVWKV